MKQAEYQISLFDGDHKLTIDKPIRLIELFAGYGSGLVDIFGSVGMIHCYHYFDRWKEKKKNGNDKNK